MAAEHRLEVSAPTPASGDGSEVRLRTDASPLAILTLIVSAVVGVRFYYDNWLSDFDIFTFFMPNFGYVGDRLREFEVPAWNPYFSSGTPMAGDASGGWMYLPVMLAFTIFSAATGIKVMLLIQALVGGIATYLFTRRIGLIPMAALFSGVAFAIGPVIYQGAGYITVVSQANTFIPVGLLGAESALRARRWSSRLGWAALTGVAITQMFVSWPGQGVLYGSMYIIGWMAYRWLIAPVPEVGSRLEHLRRLVVTGLATAIVAAAFGAAGILPRFDFNAQSTIPGGDYSQVIGGDHSASTFPLTTIVGLFFQDALYPRIVSFSAQVILLALFAILVGRGRHGVPFFAVMAAIFIDLAAIGSVTRWAFDLIPGFDLIHGHRPNVTVWLLPTAMAVLAGAGFQFIVAVRRRPGMLARLLPLSIALLAIIWIKRSGAFVGYWTLWIGFITTILMILPAIALTGRWRAIQRWLPRGVAALLLVLLVIYPNGVDLERAVATPDYYVEYGGLFGRNGDVHETVEEVLGRDDPGGAGEFLTQQDALRQPFRYAPFTGTGGPSFLYASSSHRRLDPALAAILGNGRSARLGLEQTSGYNPLHLKVYVQYVETMNGSGQDYHWLDFMPSAVNGTPLLDMLNVRYVLVPATLDPQPAIAEWGTIAWQNDEVIVYENPNVLPRAWLVHDVWDNQDGEGLLLLNSGMIDPRQVAFVDGEIPAVAAVAPGAAPDYVNVVRHAPERIELTARSSAPGLLVVSEVYAEGWTATVDGEEVEILRTNHALRGVPLLAGEHTIVMTYEPRSLTIGLWSTGLASVMLLGIWAWALVDWRRRGRVVAPSPDGPLPRHADQREHPYSCVEQRIARDAHGGAADETQVHGARLDGPRAIFERSFASLWMTRGRARGSGGRAGAQGTMTARQPIKRGTMAVRQPVVRGARVRAGTHPRRVWWRSADALALGVLVLFCAVAAALRAMYLNWMAGFDGMGDFFPDWAYMGDRLRDLQVPAWNPYFSSGSPFAGDPGSSWMYLPIMVAFALFPALTAWIVFIFLLALICSFAMYGFARRIGMRPVAALFPSAAFATGQIAYGLANDRIAITTTYLPIIVGLLAAEMAFHARRPVAFWGWVALGGVALSQNFGAWVAQGMLYTGMYVGGWLAYRWLLAPIPDVGSRLVHLRKAVLFGVGATVAAVGFGGAALWPMLSVTNQSTIPGGDYSQAFGGVQVESTVPILNVLALLLLDLPYFRVSTAGGAVVFLALFALGFLRNRYGVPYFALTAWIFTDIASNEAVWRPVFALVPYFEHVHAHRATSASAFIFPALLLLAGSGIQLLLDEPRLRVILRALAIAGGLFGLLLWRFRVNDQWIGRWPIGISIVAAAIILVASLPAVRNLRWGRLPLIQVAAASFLILLSLYPTGVDYTRLVRGTDPTSGLTGVLSPDNLRWVVTTTAKQEDPGTAAEFLQQQRDLRQPFRYAPFFNNVPGPGYASSTQRRLEPQLVAILANGRSARLGLEQITGYNPLHLRYYDEYIATMNGAPQDYHWVDLFTPALNGTPLLDMLNVRYVVVAATLPEPPPIAYYGKEVYRDELSIIYENPNVFPRAWIVHDVRDNNDGDGLLLLNSGMLNARQVAFVDGPLPEVAVPTGAGPGDEVTVTSHEPERIELAARTSAPGLLVVSEVYTEGWNAYVDGDRVDVLRTNHALRGVPLPAGEHEVVLKYEPRSLTIGLWSTGLTSLAMLGIWGWAATEWRRSRRHSVAVTRPWRGRGRRRGRPVRTTVKRPNRQGLAKRRPHRTRRDGRAPISRRRVG